MRIIALAVTLLLSWNVAHATSEDPFKEVTADDILTMQQGENAPLLIDARGKAKCSMPIIKGAIQLPANQTNTESLANIIPTKDTSVVFYCGNLRCQASTVSAFRAVNAGYTNVHVYHPGIEDWKSRGLPLQGEAAKC